MRIHLSGAPETEHCRRAERNFRHPDDYGAGQRCLAGWYPSIRNNQQQSPMAEQGIRLSARVRREQCAIVCRVHAKSQWALIPYVPMFRSQTAKLSPHEQCATALGFVTLKPPVCSSALASVTEPLTKSALFGSITSRTFEIGTRISRSFGPSTRSMTYCRPEHPPPTTARRSAPSGFPFCSSSDSSLRAAFSVIRIRRSLPIL